MQPMQTIIMLFIGAWLLANGLLLYRRARKTFDIGDGVAAQCFIALSLLPFMLGFFQVFE